MPPRISSARRASHRLLKLTGIATFAVLSAGIGYVFRDPDIRKAIDYKITLALTDGIVTVLPTEAGTARKPLTQHVAHLFSSGQKGPRADHVAQAMGFGDAITPFNDGVSRRNKSSSLMLAAAKEEKPEDKRAVSASATIFLAGLSGNTVTSTPTQALINPIPEPATPPSSKYPGEWSGLLKNASLSPEQARSGTLFGGLTENEFRERELRCMATAIYFEARDEPIKGQIAVGQVVMNRIRSPYYPKTICGVVYQGERLRTGCQFSFTCTGRPARVNEKPEWANSVKIAKQVIAREVWVNEVGYATHYHATYVKPDWRHELDKVVTIGTHIFYKPRPGTLQVALLSDGM